MVFPLKILKPPFSHGFPMVFVLKILKPPFSNGFSYDFPWNPPWLVTMLLHPLGRPTSHRQRCRDQSEGSLRPGIIQGFHCGSICHYVISTRWWHMIAGHSWSFFTCRYLRSTQSWASRKNRENHLFQDSEILCHFGNPSCGPSGPTNFIGGFSPPKAAQSCPCAPRWTKGRTRPGSHAPGWRACHVARGARCHVA